MKNNNFFGKIDNIELKPYSENYPSSYLKEIDLLKNILSGIMIEHHHIGSTAVPGILSKPVIDIALAINPFPLSEKFINEIENVGYKYWSENPDNLHQYFIKNMPRTHHLHIYPQGSKKLIREIAFRDLLLKDQNLSKEYEKLKINLAKKYYGDREKYTNEKTSFIKSALGEK